MTDSGISMTSSVPSAHRKTWTLFVRFHPFQNLVVVGKALQIRRQGKTRHDRRHLNVGENVETVTNLDTTDEHVPRVSLVYFFLIHSPSVSLSLTSTLSLSLTYMYSTCTSSTPATFVLLTTNAAYMAHSFLHFPCYSHINFNTLTYSVHV